MRMQNFVGRSEGQRKLGIPGSRSDILLKGILKKKYKFVN